MTGIEWAVVEFGLLGDLELGTGTARNRGLPI